MMKKVIIIDDSITQLNLIKTAFAQEGWEAYGAQNAKDGWEMIYDAAPDLIITDAIMPKIGGFQLVKAIREEELISKIPVIIYSVLSENNAKFYLGKNDNDYFFKKDEDIKKLIKLANQVTQEHEITESEKIEILKAGINKIPIQNQDVKPITDDIFEEEIETQKEEIQIPVEKIDTDKLNGELKEIYDFSLGDDKLLSEFFSILYPYLKYDLFLVDIYSPLNKKNTLYFDIRDIILSPIFQNKMLEKYKGEDIVLFKNYAPNLKTIVSEEEFFSKIEFFFEYRDIDIAKVAFYSKEKQKWSDDEELEGVKNAFYNFFKARFINKNLSNQNQKPEKNKYSSSKFDFPFLNKTETKKEKTQMYIAIIEIMNFDNLEEELSEEELDIINMKISERIIKCLDINEQIYKNAKDEYIIMIIALDEKQAYHKLNYMANMINSISFNGYDINAVIGASNCIIDNVFDVTEAQKTARLALDLVTKTEKVVIKNAAKQPSDTD